MELTRLLHKKKTLNSSITILFIAIVWMVLFLKSFLEEMENEMRQNEEEADNDIEDVDDTDNPQE